MSNGKGLQIALAGKMRSGKDTAGEYLFDKYAFSRFAFADGIVKTAKKLFPEHFETGVKPRKLLQEFGQYCVGIDRLVWVNALFREMLWQGIDPVTDNVVITDVRQPHEVEKLRESGFIIIRVNCLDEIRLERMKEKGEIVTSDQFFHETELAVDRLDVDFEIYNDGTPEELFQQIEVILDEGGFR